MKLISKHYRAGYPAVAIETVEDRRVADIIVGEVPENASVVSINACGDLTDVRNGEVLDSTMPFAKAFAAAVTTRDTILIVYDWHHVAANAGQYRALKTQLPKLKSVGSMVVLVAPAWRMPAELRSDVPVLRLPLPSREHLSSALSVIADAIGNGDGPVEIANTDTVLDAATGLTLDEAESAFALGASRAGVDSDAVLAEKMRLVRSSGHLEVAEPISAELVGGLDNLKSYVTDQVQPWRGDPTLAVKGVLLVGVPGTGKSASAKAIASLLDLPLIRLDVGRLMGGVVGESEGNMSAALDIADAISPCVLWIDEIEKGVGGYKSSAKTDGGTTLRMLGRFLTWMQERTSDVLVVATCNDYSALPAELTRPGRFSERFFVDVPTTAERVQIAAIHLKRVGARKSIKPSQMAQDIADRTQDWTGAEIEELVISAARLSDRKMTDGALGDAHQAIKPMCKVRGDEIDALRQWGNSQLRRANADSVREKVTRAIREEAV